MMQVYDFSENGEVRVFMGYGTTRERVDCDEVQQPHKNVRLGFKDGKLVAAIITEDR